MLIRAEALEVSEGARTDAVMYSVTRLLLIWGGVEMSPLGTSATLWSIEPVMDDDDDDDDDACGMRTGKGNQSTRRKNLPQFHFIHHKCNIT
jgi:hypothetical protein